MAHEVKNAELGKDAQVFTVGTPAWHRLGKTVETAQTAEEAMKLAGLGWHVEQVGLVTADGQPIENRFLNRIKEDGTHLGVVSDKYQILQNAEAFGFCDELVGKDAAIYHTAGALSDGKRVFMQVKLPQDLVIGRNDVIEQYLTLYNSHDGKGAVRVYFTPTRVVCANTLAMSLGNTTQKVNIAHVGTLEQNVREAYKTLELAVNYGTRFKMMAEDLAAMKLTKKTTRSLIAQLVPDSTLADVKQRERAAAKVDRMRSEIYESVYNSAGSELKEARGTGWGLLNGVSFWSEHQRTRSSEEARMEQVLHGTEFKLRNKVLNLLQAV